MKLKGRALAWWDQVKATREWRGNLEWVVKKKWKAIWRKSFYRWLCAIPFHASSRYPLRRPYGWGVCKRVSPVGCLKWFAGIRGTSDCTIHWWLQAMIMEGLGVSPISTLAKSCRQIAVIENIIKNTGCDETAYNFPTMVDLDRIQSKTTIPFRHLNWDSKMKRHWFDQPLKKVFVASSVTYP